ncbi:YbaB/EbfC family nucleoid-associated protein [Paractinoplanes hotanensis]|uniref:YbaB/EbfC family nucleoid-associated protein n=1 Tax=Paractinoplanes hotanensis TaxID=2906497 RepID=A0ABT0YBZ0_9ACTN|nr:YbaB/EbfC family nucleoid-associated protein [Actinoplanes hotanensis]MCM4083575.1 YbaB/EbfC family nucleoid-associated protein [Actinoplanes hotanensis]
MQPAPELPVIDLEERLAHASATGRSADGTVTVVVSGFGDVRAVRVDPQALPLTEVEALEVAITQAVSAALDASRRLVEQAMAD